MWVNCNEEPKSINPIPIYVEVFSNLIFLKTLLSILFSFLTVPWTARTLVPMIIFPTTSITKPIMNSGGCILFLFFIVRLRGDLNVVDWIVL